MTRAKALGAGFLATLIATFLRSYRCLESFIVSQDDLSRAACALYFPEAGFWDFAARTFKRAALSYEPLSDILFWLMLQAGWSVPLGPRILAAVLLAACAFMTALIALRFLRDKRWAAAAGLFYILHPMHNINETVLGVPHYLAVLLILASFMLHMKEEDLPAQKPRILSACALYLSAALFKETGLLLPLFLLGYDYFNALNASVGFLRSARSRKKYAALFITALLYAAFRLYLGGEGIRLSPSAVTEHLRQTLSGSSRLLIALAAVAALWTARKDEQINRTLYFCGFWFVLGSFIYLFLPEYYALTDRHLFLPSVGLAWAFAVSLDALSRKKTSAALIIPALMLFALAEDGFGRLGCRGRDAQLEDIRAGLTHCSPRPGFTSRLNSRCVDGAASLPIIRDTSPADYQETLSGLKRILSPNDFEGFLRFYGTGTLSENCPKWAYLSGRRREWLRNEPLMPLLKAYTSAPPNE